MLPLAALSLASCVNDSLEEKLYKQKSIVITANSDNGTRTQLETSGGKVTCWQPDDSISVFSFYEGSTEQDWNIPFRNIEKHNSTTARFLGTINIAIGANNTASEFEYGDKWAVYPYSKSNKWNSNDGGYMETSIPGIQTAYPGTFDPKAQPLVARSRSMDFGFYNVSGNLCFKLPSSMYGINRIELKGKNREALSGKVHISFNGDTLLPSVSPDAENRDTMIVLLPQYGCDTIATDTLYYLSLVPCILADGLELVFYRSDSYATMTINAPVPIGRAQVQRIKDSHFEGFDTMFVDLPVTEIIMIDSLSLDPDDTYQFTYTVSPDEAPNKALLWTSSNPDSISVDSTGLITALYPGCSAVITAQSVACPAITAKCHVTVKSVVNLSENGTANCYIVSKKGYYKINATVRGKSSEAISASVIADSAFTVWETYGTQEQINKGELINNVHYKNGELFFSIPQNNRNGNAVIAICNKNGKILWSWHIWVYMGFDPEESQQTYPNNAGIFMDRNLGATTTNGYDTRFFGLFYQWGRKDPFVGNDTFESYVQQRPKVSGKMWETVISTEQTGTFEYSISEPTKFIVSSNGDWIYDKSLNDRWSRNIAVSDPCPKGWTIPSYDFMKKAFNNPSESGMDIYKSSDVYKSPYGLYLGVNLKRLLGTTEDIRYPYTGYIEGNSESIYDYGDVKQALTWTCVWTRGLAKSTESYHYAFCAQNIDYISYYFSINMNCGATVRCIKE